MNINRIERFLLNSFLKEFSNHSITELDELLPSIKVKSRDFTGVGFFTTFHISNQLKIGGLNESYVWREMEVKLNGVIDTGYLFYIDNGYLSCIEGYTYNEDWPEEIFEIEIEP